MMEKSSMLWSRARNEKKNVIDVRTKTVGTIKNLIDSIFIHLKYDHNRSTRSTTPIPASGP